MSDIAIRLDGLLLLAVVVLTGLAFAVVCMVGLVARRSRLAKGAVALAGISLAVVGGIVLTIDAPLVRSQPYDWVDWLIVPWLALVAMASLHLARATRVA